MATKTEDEKAMVLEALLNEARTEADDLRKKLEHYQRIISSTRLIMGHELKKPTTAISGYLDLVCEDLEDFNQLKTLTYADKARRECKLLNDLNTFYLELLQIDSSEDMVGHERVDVADVIDEVIAEFPGKYHAGDRVVVKRGRGVRPIRINRNALKLILLNVIENAILYAQVSTPVKVEVERAPEKRGMADSHVLKVRVIDDGVGIPESYLKRIFSPFVRLREDIAEGSGLGLTLARSLVELSGGEIYIRSGEGRGTVVHITLPADDNPDEKPVIKL